jgi:hypothetical protein
MERGAVKKYVRVGNNTGWGFIKPKSGGKLVYFSYRSGRFANVGQGVPALSASWTFSFRGAPFRPAMHFPKVGDQVVFERKESPRGPKVRVWCFANNWDSAVQVSQGRSNKHVTRAANMD